MNNKIKIVPVYLHNEFVQKLIGKLDQYQIALYGIERCNLDPVDVLQKSGAYVLGAYSKEVLVGIGAVKILDNYAEVKRMFVEEAYRGSGIAKMILIQLEEHAKKNGIEQVYLETGNLHNEALRFYKKFGYSVIERFGGYEPNEVSIYFSKKI